MNERLIQQFYAACPIWLWPVLWLQIILMDEHFAALEAEAGHPINCMIALSHWGTLHISFMSDEASAAQMAEAWRARPSDTLDMLHMETQPAYVWLNWLMQRVSATYAERLPAARTTPLHLEPG